MSRLFLYSAAALTILAISLGSVAAKGKGGVKSKPAPKNHNAPKAHPKTHPKAHPKTHPGGNKTHPVGNKTKPVGKTRPVGRRPGNHLAHRPFDPRNPARIRYFPKGGRWYRGQWAGRYGVWVYGDYYGRNWYFNQGCSCYRPVCELPCATSDMPEPQGDMPMPTEGPPPDAPPDMPSPVDNPCADDGSPPPETAAPPE